MCDIISIYESLVTRFRDAHGKLGLGFSLEYCRTHPSWVGEEFPFHEIVLEVTGARSEHIGRIDIANLDSTVDPVWRHWLVFADTEEGIESKEQTSRQFRDLATEAGAHLPLALRQSTFGENEPHHYADRWLTLLFRYLQLNPMQCRTAEGEILPSGLVSHIPFDKCADLIESELLPQIQGQHNQEAPLATGQTGHETGQAEEKTKTPPFPATLGFREFFNRVQQSETGGEKPNKAELSREIGVKHRLKPTTLADTYRRYIRRLKSSGQ